MNASAPGGSALWVNESGVNATEGYRLGDSGVYETSFEEPGKLYRFAVREYGRCIGRVYIDNSAGESIAIGWVFVKRQQYEDSRPRYDDYGKRVPPQTYLHETWLTVHTAPDTVTRTPHFLVIGRKC